VSVCVYVAYAVYGYGGDVKKLFVCAAAAVLHSD